MADLMSRVLKTDAGTTVTVQDAELTDGTAVGCGIRSPRRPRWRYPRTLAAASRSTTLSLTMTRRLAPSSEPQASVAVSSTLAAASRSTTLSLTMTRRLAPTGSPDVGETGEGGGLYTSGGSVSILNSTLSHDAAYGGGGFASIIGGPGVPARAVACTPQAVGRSRS